MFEADLKRRRIQAGTEIPRHNSLTESQHCPSPLTVRLSHAASEVVQHRVATADGPFPGLDFKAYSRTASQQ